MGHVQSLSCHRVYCIIHRPLEEIVELFKKDNRKVVNFKRFDNDDKMALVEMVNLEDAVDALVVSASVCEQ